MRAGKWCVICVVRTVLLCYLLLAKLPFLRRVKMCGVFTDVVLWNKMFFRHLLQTLFKESKSQWNKGTRPFSSIIMVQLLPWQGSSLLIFAVYNYNAISAVLIRNSLISPKESLFYFKAIMGIQDGNFNRTAREILIAGGRSWRGNT